MRKAQSSHILASIAIAAIMFTLVSSYVSSQRIALKSEYSEVPAMLRHMKADLDSDFSTIFCDAGLCISSTHPGSAILSYNLNYHSSLFSNLSNFTGSYAARFSSSRLNLSTSELLSALSSNRLLLRDNATDTNFSLRKMSNNNLSLNFNSSSVTSYSLFYNCTNTSAITWNPEITESGNIDFSFSVPDYHIQPEHSEELLSLSEIDGQIVYDNKEYYIITDRELSEIGFDKTFTTYPDVAEAHSYLTFKTNNLPDDATILSASLIVFTDTLDYNGHEPTWDVEYRMATDTIGDELTSDAWNNGRFTSMGTITYTPTTEIDFDIPSEYLTMITLTGRTDFELVPTWADQIGEGEYALANIKQTESPTEQPVLKVTYIASGSKISRSLNYSANFSTVCGPINVSIIKGNLYSNFSYMKFEMNTTIPTNETVGIFPYAGREKFATDSPVIKCTGGREPTYPSTVSNATYGKSSISGTETNYILANRSGSFNTLYFDTNGNCNFTDFHDEYFITLGEWMHPVNRIGKLQAIASDGSNFTVDFASAGVEETLSRARLVQPIYLNK